MGTSSSKCNSDDVDIKFVGREDEFKKVGELLKQKKSVGIYGLRKVGKSRFLTELCQRMFNSETVCIYKDFNINDIKSSYQRYKMFHDIFTLTGMYSALNDLIKTFPCESIACRICTKCDQGKECLRSKEYMDQVVNSLTENLQCCRKQICFFFDDINKLLESDLKDSFLCFVDNISRKCSNVSLIFCPCDNVIRVQDSFERVFLGPLKKIDILKIFFLMTESHNDYAGECIQGKEQMKDMGEGWCLEQRTYADLFKEDNEYFTPENKESMEELAGVCDGHPAVAVLAITLLMEDGGLLTLTELIELIKEVRSKVNYPGYSYSDISTGDYNTPMLQLELIFREILQEEVKHEMLDVTANV